MKPTEIDTNALDTPVVVLPTIPCSHPDCEQLGDHMVMKPGESQYSFWCADHVPPAPLLVKPDGVE